ncbi:MAG: hypothetical protein ACOYNU_11330 [Bacteroidales bacterium]
MISNQFRSFIFVVLLLSAACDRRYATEYAPVAGGFKFSADLKLSAVEIKADSVLNSMRRELLSRKGFDWSFFSSFSGHKAEIQNEALYRVFKKMPKGGMLHIHASATGDAQWIIDKALSMPGCYIFWSADNTQFVKGELKFFPDHVIPPGFLPIQQLSSEDPLLSQKLFPLYTIGPEDDSIPDIWAEFEKVFSRVDDFVSYRPVFTEHYRHAFDLLASDGVQFVELRTSLDKILNEDGTYTKDEALLDLYQGILAGTRTKYPAFDLCIIANSWRGLSLDGVASQLERVSRLKSEYPGMIGGFDLIGEEDGFHSNEFFSVALSNSPLPLFLHSGESLSLANTNIRDALNMNAPRIGHGVNLFYFPDLEKTIISRGTLLEMCPISNQALRYVKDFRLHPGQGYLRNGVQGTLGSDDPAFFQSSGLTDDYFVAYLSWGINLRSVKKMLLNSITYSGMPDYSVQSQLSLFNKNWDGFIQYVNGL